MGETGRNISILAGVLDEVQCLSSCVQGIECPLSRWSVAIGNQICPYVERCTVSQEICVCMNCAISFQSECVTMQCKKVLNTKVIELPDGKVIVACGFQRQERGRDMLYCSLVSDTAKRGCVRLNTSLGFAYLSNKSLLDCSILHRPPVSCLRDFD